MVLVRGVLGFNPRDLGQGSVVGPVVRQAGDIGHAVESKNIKPK